MKISVIIPVYNRHELTIRAARSVLAQGQNDLELIIVDDYSEPAFICPYDLAHDMQVTVLRHAKNRGAGAARNTGIKQAQGDYVVFLDSDDVWRPGKLDAQLTFAAKHETSRDAKPKAYVCGFRLKSAVTGRDRILQPVAVESLGDFASGIWFCPGSTLMLPRQVFDLVGGYDESLKRLEDLDWFIRFGLAGGALYSVDGIFVDIEAATRPSSDAVITSITSILDKYRCGDDKSQCLNRRVYRLLKAYLALELAAVYYSHGERYSAGINLARSFMLKPRLGLHLKDWWSHDQRVEN